MAKFLINFISIAMYILFSTVTYGATRCNISQNKQILRYNLVDGLPDIYIHPESEKIGCTWANGTIWEKHLIQKFYSLLPKYDSFVAIDLGAQTGCFSLLAKYFPHSTWYAFEPIQEAADLLRENLRLNDIHNVSVYQMAAADFSGIAKLKMLAMKDWGLSTIGKLRFDAVFEREIQCITLDSFIEAQHIQKVHFMKLDTEGSELNILRGAQKMIIRDHPIIIMEYIATRFK